MKYVSVKQYLRHYGKIRSLRGSAMASTFKRVTAAFDEYDDKLVREAIEALEQDPNSDLACVYCGMPAEGWDHVHPAAKGGTHQMRNLVPCCTSCNHSKGNKTWERFLGSKGLGTEKRVTTLKQYTEHYARGALLVDENDKVKLEAILQEIRECMDRADAIIQSALSKRKT